MTIALRGLTIADYDSVLALWRSSEGIGLSAADERSAIERYLAQNPGMSFVAIDDGRLVGAVLCGHDGRRGYLHHLAVTPSHRCQGIGRQLVEQCLRALKAAGIDKCHLFVFAGNTSASDFWKRIGWTQRDELLVMSRHTPR
jgi:putative acetyltransferase